LARLELVPLALGDLYLLKARALLVLQFGHHVVLLWVFGLDRCFINAQLQPYVRPRCANLLLRVYQQVLPHLGRLVKSLAPSLIVSRVHAPHECYLFVLNACNDCPVLLHIHADESLLTLINVSYFLPF
jgi:hypothetical protein